MSTASTTSTLLRLGATSSPAPRALRVSTSRLSVVISNTTKPAAASSRQQRRSISAGPRLLLKEDAVRTGDEADAAKRAQLRKQKDGEGRWHEELASASEVNVRADREAGGVADHGEHMRELQGLGKEKGEKGEL